MKLKLLLVIGVLVFIGQITFSIYFSIKIVDENSTINLLTDKLNQLQVDNQSLKNQFAAQNSLEKINEFATTQSYKPINNTIDLSP